MIPIPDVQAEVSRERVVPTLLRVGPPLMGLVYPALVWCIHGISPFALALTLLTPGVCLYAVFQLNRENRYRWATMAAYLGVGAPALYTFLGGWLDSQKWIPYRGNGVWVVIWCGLLLLTAIERRGEIKNAGARPAELAVAHGVSGALITVFAVFHLTNHLAGVFGGEAHMAVMRILRIVYRQPPVEVLLGGCVLFQAASGSVLLLRRMRRPSPERMEILQNASGAYVLLFFASHISAVLRTRYLYHVDTNWVWLTADNLLKDSWSVRLVPYYFLGVVALAVHGGCGLRWVLGEHGRKQMGERTFAVTVAAGGAAALVIIIAMVLGSLHG